MLAVTQLLSDHVEDEYKPVVYWYHGTIGPVGGWIPYENDQCIDRPSNPRSY